ncbi:hypothetical protein Noda2021_02650 [Candidatus Dependentiae bacterium Noda2021]|nr:hypothetical protein Noda2021_02650 [Candidatus Dependentiae bacterium Noda2021]
MLKVIVLRYLMAATVISIPGQAFANFFKQNPPEKSQIPQALISIGQGANNLAKQGITIQAQVDLIQSMNSVAQSAHELVDKGITISFADRDIHTLNNTALHIIKSGCVAAVGTSLSVLSVYYLYRSIFYSHETHHLYMEQKKAIHNRGIKSRLVLPLISMIGISAGLTIIKKCEQIAC